MIDYFSLRKNVQHCEEIQFGRKPSRESDRTQTWMQVERQIKKIKYVNVENPPERHFYASAHKSKLVKIFYAPIPFKFALGFLFFKSMVTGNIDVYCWDCDDADFTPRYSIDAIIWTLRWNHWPLHVFHPMWLHYFRLWRHLVEVNETGNFTNQKTCSSTSWCDIIFIFNRNHYLPDQWTCVIDSWTFKRQN